MQVPSISHPTDRPNFTEATVNGVTVYFSYRTPIAFRSDETGLVVRENDWSTTTGKHLNYIDGGNKKSRISGEAFQAALAAL